MLWCCCHVTLTSSTTDLFRVTSDGMLQKDVVMLNFFPQLGESAFSNKHEFIFVIDRSGIFIVKIIVNSMTCVNIKIY